MCPIIRCRRITATSPTPKKLTTFLRHLEESGSVSFAAQRTGIGRNTVYERRKVDPAFARSKRVGSIREYDNRLLRFQLRALQPEVYGQGGGRRGR